MLDQIYQTLCATLDMRKLPYEKSQEQRSIRCTVQGRDIPIEFLIKINEKRQLVEYISILPCQIPEDKRIEAAMATTVANYGLYDGNICYDITKGLLVFRITCSTRGGKPGPGLFEYMMDCGRDNVDKYNDRFLALAKGEIGIGDFISLE